MWQRLGCRGGVDGSGRWSQTRSEVTCSLTQRDGLLQACCGQFLTVFSVCVLPLHSFMIPAGTTQEET